jgi:hypothetical protein
MKRRLFNALAICSAILFVTVCVFWVRSRTRWDQLSFMYCRYLPDQSITSDEVHVSSNLHGVGLLLMHGHAPPRPVDLVRGYDLNADKYHGRPTMWFQSEKYDPTDWFFLKTPASQRRSPVELSTFRRQQPKDIDDSRSITLVMSHWLLALLLLVMPAWWLKRFRQARRARRQGLCPSCGYDLRATPHRCPECGRESEPIARVIE